MDGQKLKGTVGVIFVLLGVLAITGGIVGSIQDLLLMRNTRTMKATSTTLLEALRKAEGDPSFDRNWIAESRAKVEDAQVTQVLGEGEALQRMIGALTVLVFGLVFVFVGRLLRRGVRDVFNKNVL
jgi:hypothetical protein